MTTPKHYQAPTDTIDYIHMHRGLIGVEEFCIGNILKYATRYGKKDEKIKEIEKIIVYANRLKEIVEDEKSEFIKKLDEYGDKTLKVNNVFSDDENESGE